MSAPSPYSIAGERLVQRGFSAIPIAPDSKAPGFYSHQKGWRRMSSWSRYCDRLPTSDYEVPFWAEWPDAGVGIAATHGINFADIDTINFKIVDVIKAILPPSPAIKTGQKGETLFYRADFPARHFDIDGERVLDWLGHGTQTCVPPTIHPDICAPYRWTGFRHLQDLSPDDLPIVTAGHMAELVAGLEKLGYREPAPIMPCGDDDSDSPFRQLNNAALANLDAWVPRLGLPRVKRVCNGYRAVAWWRPSHRGRPLEQRGLNLKIHSKGIRDFHHGRSYTAIDLTMEALDCDRETAFARLSDWLGRTAAPDFIQFDRKAESVAMHYTARPHSANGSQRVNCRQWSSRRSNMLCRAISLRAAHCLPVRQSSAKVGLR